MFEALFGSLVTPALYAAAILGVTVVANPQYLYVSGVTVPTEVEERGYSEHEAASRLANAIVLLDQRVKRIQPSKQIAVLDANSPVQLIGNQLNLTPFIRVVQHAAGVADKSLAGAITVVDGEEIEFTARVTRDDGARVALVRKGSLKEIDGLFHIVASDIYRSVAPYSFALLELEKGLPGRQFEELRKHVAAMIASAPHPHERAWFHNLLGLMEGLEGDHPRAQKHFARAIVESPTPFPLGRLNIGHSKYLAGDHAGAIEEYRKALMTLGVPFEARGVLRAAVETGVDSVARIYNDIVDFADRTPRPLYSRPELIATVLTAWGLAEERLGRDDCAEALYAMALKSDASNEFARDMTVVFLKKIGRTAEAENLAGRILEPRGQSHEDLPSLLRLSDRMKHSGHAAH